MQKLTKLDHALDLARRGFAVFPLVANSKVPATANWQNLATTDESQIRQWWAQDPERNIGAPTANYVVVDVDPRNGGDATFAELTLLDEFPKTARATTRAGGDHIFYALPPHTTVKGGTDKLGKGVDIKSWGGYVVAAGSTVDGKPYAWANERPVAAAPQWLIDRCNAHRPRTEQVGKRLVEEDDDAVRLARAWLTNHSPDAHLGTIDDTAFKVAARFYDFGVSAQTATELLAEWSDTHAFPPMQLDRIQVVAESAGRNRDNAVGTMHPGASGFQPVDIGPQPPLKDDKKPTGLFYVSFKDGAARALTHNAEPLVEGILDCGTMSVVYGESNSGKSFQEMDKDFSIAIGQEWAGRAVKQGTVVWVAAEGGAGVYKRLAALKEHYGVPDAPFFVVPCPVNLLKADADVGPLIALIKGIAAEHGPVVKVTLDTLSRVIAGGDENSSMDMGKLVHHFDLIREHTGAHLAVIHHTGKDKAKGARGHSLLRAATDTEIEIADRTITVTKQRDMDGDVEMRFRLVPVRVGTDARGKEVTSCWVEVNAQGDKLSIPLTGAERFALYAVVEHLHNATKKTFQTHNITGKCRSFDTDTLLGRSTVSGLLSDLSDKGWLEKDSKHSYLRTCRKVSEGVGGTEDIVSEYFGYLTSRNSPTVPAVVLAEQEGFGGFADWERARREHG